MKLDAEVKSMQQLINSGTAWRLEGSVGRSAMALIENGLCILGREGHKDYYDNYVPSRTEVKESTKGSKDYVAQLRSAAYAELVAKVE